jgi:PHD/YefM family antitoxin component YafN of YafNO toxin-antitoxin module
MRTVHPQYIKDTAGKNLVILPQNEFDDLMEELEELEDIRLYDEDKKNDTGERIPMEDAFKIVEAKRDNRDNNT